MMDGTANTMMMGGAPGMMAPGAAMMMGNPAGGMMMTNFGYPMMMQPQPQPQLQQPTAFGPGAFVEPYDFCKQPQAAQLPMMQQPQAAQMTMMQQAPTMMYGANIMRYGAMGGAPMMMMNQTAFANPAAAAAAAGNPAVAGAANPADGQVPGFAPTASSTKIKITPKPKTRAVQYDRKVG